VTLGTAMLYGQRTNTDERLFMTVSRVRLLIAQFLTMALLAGGALIFMPGLTEPASAAPNGCTAVPDSGYGFNFLNSCNNHDNCYEFQYYGSSASGRKACDVDFLNDMRAHCSTRSSWGQRAVCRAVAYTYYYGVRAFGGFFFDSESGTRIA